jgi:nucleotide-binding universal stress UspA family protein
MTYKSILVHVEHIAAAEPRLATAVALARRFDATLMGFGGESFDWVGVSDPYGFTAGQWLSVVAEQIQADLVTAEKTFRKFAKDVSHEWLAAQTQPAQAMANLSRSADLIVAGGAPLDDGGVYRTASPAELVIQSGRPVLVAPPQGGALRAKQIVVAWKDSREARRAISDALPFLKAADEVVVMAVCPEAEHAGAQHQVNEVARHLTRHGAPARGKAKIAPSNAAAIELNMEAEALGADLIVSGAYGHTRLRELILGGVTRDFLTKPERFVLLSH